MSFIPNEVVTVVAYKGKPKHKTGKVMKVNEAGNVVTFEHGCECGPPYYRSYKVGELTISR